LNITIMWKARFSKTAEPDVKIEWFKIISGKALNFKSKSRNIGF
jgi:hypothetical protein